MNKAFIPSICLPAPNLQPTLWFIFQNDEILLDVRSNIIKIPEMLDDSTLNFEIKQKICIGKYGNFHCFAVQVHNATTPLPPGMEFRPIRQSFFALNDENIFLIASRAMEILYWDRRTQFCGCCGERTQFSDVEPAKVCMACKALFFPQISPAVLALIWRDDEILLGRSPHFLPGVYSILAGFVEPGETIEQCLVREVREEVNITIKNIQYFSSQAWPFPNMLMIGFVSEYDSGEIQVNADELEDAQWFSIRDLPTLPNPLSLSRRMIEEHVASKKSY